MKSPESRVASREPACDAQETGRPADVDERSWAEAGELIDRMGKNLLDLLSRSREDYVGSMVEQEVDERRCPNVRWWQGNTADLVRTRDGSAWLVLPKGWARFPPLLANLFLNDPAETLRSVVEGGGGILIAEKDNRLCRDWEILLAGRRR